MLQATSCHEVAWPDQPNVTLFTSPQQQEGTSVAHHIRENRLFADSCQDVPLSARTAPVHHSAKTDLTSMHHDSQFIACSHDAPFAGRGVHYGPAGGAVGPPRHNVRWRDARRLWPAAGAWSNRLVSQFKSYTRLWDVLQSMLSVGKGQSVVHGTRPCTAQYAQQGFWPSSGSKSSTTT